MIYSWRCSKWPDGPALPAKRVERERNRFNGTDTTEATNERLVMSRRIRRTVDGQRCSVRRERIVWLCVGNDLSTR